MPHPARMHCSDLGRHMMQTALGMAHTAAPSVMQVVRMLGDQRLQQWMAAIEPMPLPSVPTRPLQGSSHPGSREAAPEEPPSVSGQQLPVPGNPRLAAAYLAFFGPASACCTGQDAASDGPATPAVSLTHQEAAALSMLVVAVDNAVAGGGVAGLSQGGTSVMSCEDSSATSGSSSVISSSECDSDSSHEDETIRDARVAGLPTVASSHEAGHPEPIPTRRLPPLPGLEHHSSPTGGCSSDVGRDSSSGGGIYRTVSPQGPATADILGLRHPITRLLAALQAGPLCRVLLAMAVRAPAALQGLLLHVLPPAGAELLLGRLEGAQVRWRCHVARFLYAGCRPPHDPCYCANSMSDTAPIWYVTASVVVNIQAPI